MLTNAFTTTAPAGFDGARRAPRQVSAVPAPGARSWTRLPGVDAPCTDRLAGGVGGATGGAMPAVALALPAVVASRVVRLGAVQHVIDLNNPTGTTLGNHPPGRPQS